MNKALPRWVREVGNARRVRAAGDDDARTDAACGPEPTRSVQSDLRSYTRHPSYLGRARNKLWLELSATALRRHYQSSASRPFPDRTLSWALQCQRSTVVHRALRLPSGAYVGCVKAQAEKRSALLLHGFRLVDCEGNSKRAACEASLRWSVYASMCSVL